METSGHLGDMICIYTLFTVKYNYLCDVLLSFFALHTKVPPVLEI
jgi:hypothetical protein